MLKSTQQTGKIWWLLEIRIDLLTGLPVSVRWLLENENSVTMVREDAIASPKDQLVEGGQCQVKGKKKIHEGKILAIGKRTFRLLQWL